MISQVLMRVQTIENIFDIMIIKHVHFVFITKANKTVIQKKYSLMIIVLL